MVMVVRDGNQQKEKRETKTKVKRVVCCVVYIATDVIFMYTNLMHPKNDIILCVKLPTGFAQSNITLNVIPSFMNESKNPAL